MTAIEAYKAMLRDRLGPALRAHGFKGSAPTWTLTGIRGDRAVVNAQASSWNTREHVTFYVNCSLVPAPYWAWQCHDEQSDPARAVKEFDGMWRSRLAGPGRPGEFFSDVTSQWEVTDEASATTAAERVITALEAGPLTELVALTDREALMAMVRASRSWARGLTPQAVLALLLTDDDPDGELPALLQVIEEQKLWSTALITWCRDHTPPASTTTPP